MNIPFTFTPMNIIMTTIICLIVVYLFVRIFFKAYFVSYFEAKKLYENNKKEEKENGKEKV